MRENLYDFRNQHPQISLNQLRNLGHQKMCCPVLFTKIPKKLRCTPEDILRETMCRGTQSENTGV